MARRFNTTGPCLPDRHYMIPPERRAPEMRRLIDDGLFFLLHAPRQTGKTTLLNMLARALVSEGRYAAMVVSVEYLQLVTDVREANRSFIERVFAESAYFLSPSERPPPPDREGGAQLDATLNYLRAWAAVCPKPIVLLMDEIDCLAEGVMVSLLRQLRMGYTARPAPFLHSLALVGLRDLRDYRIELRANMESLGTASPFNIKSDSLTLENFTQDEVVELYAQHTADTGQVVERGAAALLYEQTRGQPWLVSALGRQITERDVPSRAEPITRPHVEAAVEALILRRDTHLDSLMDKLREERVRRVIEPILAGATTPMDLYNDDIRYVRDLGLVSPTPSLHIANPIYAEVIPRALSYVMQVSIEGDAAFYERSDGSLDMAALLRSFQQFYAENSEGWLERYDYKEAGPHLILMAFLQRIVNGGGTIRRELAVGSGRVDLLIERRAQRIALELKVRRGERTIKQGVEQLDGYLTRLRLDEGYLVVFDRRAEVSWDDKLYVQDLTSSSGRRIHVIGV